MRYAPAVQRATLREAAVVRGVRGGGGAGTHGIAQQKVPLARALGNRALAALVESAKLPTRQTAASTRRGVTARAAMEVGPATARRALVQRAVLYPNAPAPARQTMDPLAELARNRLEFGFTAPVINGTEIRREQDLVTNLHVPAVETRNMQPIAVARPDGQQVIRMGWQSRLVPTVPNNTLSYQIYLPVFRRWTTRLSKAEINRILSNLRLSAMFIDVTGNADLDMVPHPGPGAFLRHIFEHEASHAEDHIFILGRHLEPWDGRVTQVTAGGWRFDAFSEAGTERQLWGAVGMKPDELREAIWNELDEAGNEFHHSAEGASPRFLAGTVDEQAERAEIIVAPPRPPGG